MRVIFKSYFDFIQYTLNEQEKLPESVQNIDWSDFLRFCCRQGIQGIVYGGLECAGLRIPQGILFEWINVAEQTKQTNDRINRQCAEVTAFFAERGYRSCILKGQANALMYPRPELRSPGDIDVWISKEGGNRKEKLGWCEERTEIIRMIRNLYPNANYVRHHIDLPLYIDTSVEVHFTPINNWNYQRKVNKYIEEQKERQFAHRVRFSHVDGAVIGVATNDFNLVFLMLHMYKHCFTSRNSLKQMIDYFYLLKIENGNCKKEDVEGLFKRLGILRYARGVMWLMKDVFGLDMNYLVVEPDEKFGRVLLEDILEGHKKGRKGRVNFVMGRLMDNIHLMRFFPRDVFLSSLNLIFLRCWKVWRGR